MDSRALKQLQESIRPFSLKEGLNTTALPFLNLYRFTTRSIHMPRSSKPYLYLIVNGMLRLHTPSGILDHVPGQYSVSAIDSPLSGQAITASADSEFIAVSVELSPDDVISVMLDMDDEFSRKVFESSLSQATMSDLDTNLIGSVAKLINSMKRTDSLSFVSKHLKREIIFDLIGGSSGKAFLQSITDLQEAGEIYSINSWIKQNYKGSFSVEELARQLNMSVSSFHQKFKYAVGMGPLQCQKRLRLTESRRLMLDEDKTVADAAMEVGYESISQFTRDYGRMFGNSPKKDIAQLKKLLRKKHSSTHYQEDPMDSRTW